MRTVCEPSDCTMCGACIAVCSLNCISPIRDKNLWYTSIDTAKCVSCGQCEKTCPNITSPSLNYPCQFYAAWVNCVEDRTISASGGIASAFYQHAISLGWYIAGVYLDSKFEAHFKVTDDYNMLSEFRNSKYTYSYTDDSYQTIENLLKTNGGRGVLFIGLPCQVAGLQNYLFAKHIDAKCLITVDLVCHGTPFPEYLSNHVKAIENKNLKQAQKCFFRDTNFGTENFVFSLRDEKNEIFYSRRVNSDDLFQIGYHRGWIYRDNCYHCKYATKQRCGDFTIGDYSVLGRVECFNHPKDNVSYLFVNTEKGQDFLNSLQRNNLLYLEERPLEEPYTYDPQLSHPSLEKKSKERRVFMKEICKGVQFEEAAAKAFASTQTKNRINEILKINEIKNTVSKVIPVWVKNLYYKLRYPDIGC